MKFSIKESFLLCSRGHLWNQKILRSDTSRPDSPGILGLRGRSFVAGEGCRVASVRSLCGFPVRGSDSSATDPHQAEGGHRSWAHGAAGKAWLRKCKNAGQAEGGVRNSTGSNEMRKTGRGCYRHQSRYFHGAHGKDHGGTCVPLQPVEQILICVVACGRSHTGVSGCFLKGLWPVEKEL